MNAPMVRSDRSPGVHQDRPLHFSVSKQIDARFNQRHSLRLVVAGIYVVLTLIYLTWRATIFNPESMLVSAAYYVAECIGFILGLTVIFSAWRYSHREPGSAPEGVSVDVLIPTYKEPLHVIRRTVMAARDIRYPHQTWLLDDANRQEVRALASELGVNYLAREINLNAKAGNLNHGIRHSKAEFIAVFDADHIAQPHALDTLLALMDGNRIAMVQTPQDYYNTDAFQYLNPRKLSGLWHDQSYFYNLAQSCRDKWNASSCVGTGVLYRRAALESIGGIPVDTVTEDFHTSLKLHKAGWEVRYLNEPVAYGIAAADLTEYYKTRLRWAHGNLAVLKHEHILTCPGLNFKQRLSYLSLGLIYLEGWQQFLLFLVPLFALVLGWAPFEITLFNVLAVLLFPALSYLLLQEFGCGFSRFWTNELFAMARWPVHLASAIALFGRKLPWRSSAKNIQGRISWRLMLPQISVLILSALALAYAIRSLNEDFVVGPLAQVMLALLSGAPLSRDDLFTPLPAGYSLELVVIAGFWAAFNMARALTFIVKAVSNAMNSHDFYRFSLPLPISVDGRQPATGQTLALAEDWVRISLARQADRSSGQLECVLHLPDGPLQCKVAVTRNDGNHHEGKFIWDGAAERDRLAATLYSIGWQREMQNHHAYFYTPLEVLGQLLGRRPAGVEPKRTWRSGLVQTFYRPEHASPVLLTQSKTSEGHYELISFVPLAGGIIYPITLANRENKSTLVVVAELPIASLPHPGLHGQYFFRYLATIEGSIIALRTLSSPP